VDRRGVLWRKSWGVKEPMEETRMFKENATHMHPHFSSYQHKENLGCFHTLTLFSP